jgi:hypothetical protein
MVYNSWTIHISLIGIIDLPPPSIRPFPPMVNEVPTEGTHLLTQATTLENHQPDNHETTPPVAYPEITLETPKTGQGAGIFSSVMNVVNAAVGAGVLALPYAFKCTGLVLGLLVLLFIVLMTLYSCTLLARCMDKTGLVSYEKLAGLFV